VNTPDQADLVRRETGHSIALKAVPLVANLDGTLLRSDMLLESGFAFMQANYQARLC
jgi:hypothetical protein